MEDEESKYDDIWIPPNVFEGRRVFDFRGKNVREGLILVALISGFICLFPFLDRVKFILCVFIGFGVLALSAFGIKGRSVSELIIDFYRYKNSPKSYHMRSVKDSKEKALKIDEEKGKIINANKSYAEQIVDFFGRKIKEAKEYAEK